MSGGSAHVNGRKEEIATVPISSDSLHPRRLGCNEAEKTEEATLGASKQVNTEFKVRLAAAFRGANA